MWKVWTTYKSVNAQIIIMKISIQLFILLLCISSYGQAIFHKVSLTNKESGTALENVHLVTDEESGDFSVFAEEPKTTYGYLYNSDKELQSQLVSEGLKRKYKEIIGQAVRANKVRLIQKNSKGTKFASILYDFDNNTTQEAEYDLDTGRQVFLQSYSHGANCYVFSILKNSNLIRKWIFNVDGSVTKEDIDLTQELARNKVKSLNVYNLMQESQGFNSSVSMVKIENNLPNTLEIATEQNKMYEYDGGFYWTLDEDEGYTVLFDFRTPELQPNLTFIKKPLPLSQSKDNPTNSYLIEDKIAQIVSNSSMMHIEIKNLSTFNLVQEFKLEKDDPINFKNSPILQEGSVYSFGATRKMEKTSKFLRKIASDKNGLSLFKTKYGYRMTVGGVRTQGGGGGGMMMPGFGGLPIATVGAVTMSFNPASFAYGSYGATGSTRIESMFDTEFKHIEGELTDNIFDRIDSYTERLKKKADNIFIKDGEVLFGNYDHRAREYTLYSFEND